MFNDFSGYNKNGQAVKISIPPTLLISSIGVVDDITKVISPDLKFPGDFLYLLGETHHELGGSEYYSLLKTIGKSVPQVKAQKNYRTYQAFHRCVDKRTITSAASVGRGGLGVALAKTAIAGQLGIKISLTNLPGKTTRDDFSLFSESQGRIIVSVSPAKQKIFEKIMAGPALVKIGKVTDQSSIVISGRMGKTVVNLDLNQALKAYKSTFKDF